MGWTVYACTLILFASLLGQDTNASPLKLEDLLRMAEANSPTLRQAKYSWDVAELNWKNARAGYLPSLDFNATHGLLKSHPLNPTDPWDSQMALTLTENLYDNGRTLTNDRITRLQADSTKLLYEKSRAQLFLNVLQQYFAVCSDARAQSIHGDLLKSVKAQYDSAERQFRQGAMPRSDYLGFKNTLINEQVSESAAALQRKKDEEELFKYLAVAPSERTRIDLSLLEEPEIVEPGTIDPQKTYDVQNDVLQAKISDYNLSLAERKYWPQVDVKLGAGYNNAGYLGSPYGFGAGENYNASALVTLTFNIWDWGILRRSVEIADIQKHSAEDQVKADLNSVTAQVKELLLNKETNQKNLEMSREVVKSEQELSDLSWRQYREGQKTQRDLQTNLNEFLNVKINYYNVLFSVAKDVASIHYYQGNIYETYLEKH